MRPRGTPRNTARTLVVGAAAACLVGPPPVAAGGEPGPERVSLSADSGSVVRSAEIALGPGLTRLRADGFSMVGATWRGPAPRVRVRTGPGESWQRLPLLTDGPSATSGEGDSGLGATDLVWTGPRSRISVRVAGTSYRDLELVLIDPGELASDDDPDPLTSRSVAARVKVGQTSDRAPRPALYTRKDWGADNSLRNGRPHYMKRLKQIHVHHTATGNRYSRSDVPGIIRGMYRYHTQTLGWFDIGYNFLVDRFGRSWIGRSGGFFRLVRGAHTLGFNEKSVGIAMIGNLENHRPWDRAVAKLVKLSAWKLDKYGRRARGKVWVTSTGSDKYADGERVRLPVIDGHRDTNDTACPGQRLYDRLPGIRRRTQHRINRFS